jgi:hypothetical protein
MFIRMTVRILYYKPSRTHEGKENYFNYNKIM